MIDISDTLRYDEWRGDIMTATNINIYPGGELEARAQSVLADLGLDVPTAVAMFLTQVVDSGTFPFDIDEVKPAQKKRPVSELCGCFKRKIWMTDDFDAPLEEMREQTEPVKKRPKRGGWEGKIWMADDFDAPMEEFAEYM
jgi:addiction module RelB/DinJ family antitoxin